MMTGTAVQQGSVGPFGMALAIMFVIFIVIFIWWLRHLKKLEIARKQLELEEEYD